MKDVMPSTPDDSPVAKELREVFRLPGIRPSSGVPRPPARGGLNEARACAGEAGGRALDTRAGAAGCVRFPDANFDFRS
jgi:hypothetical protein